MINDSRKVSLTSGDFGGVKTRCKLFCFPGLVVGSWVGRGIEDRQDGGAILGASEVS